MKLAAANAIAGIITDAELHPEYIVPSVFDKRVAEAVAREVEAAAYRTGVARRERRKNERSEQTLLHDERALMQTLSRHLSGCADLSRSAARFGGERRSPL